MIKDSDVLTKDERAGLDEIKDGIEKKGWMIYTTDKSGKIVLDTKTNFLECMSEHYTSHRVVSAKEVRDAENMINDHSRSWMRMFNIGSESGSRQQRRCGRAIINNYSSIPSL